MRERRSNAALLLNESGRAPSSTRQLRQQSARRQAGPRRAAGTRAGERMTARGVAHAAAPEPVPRRRNDSIDLLLVARGLAANSRDRPAPSPSPAASARRGPTATPRPACCLAARRPSSEIRRRRPNSSPAAATSSPQRSTPGRSTPPAASASTSARSTGGFTDCLLQRGAAHVRAVDAGYGQLADSLRADPRVQSSSWSASMPAKCRASSRLPSLMVTIDLSFISASPPCWPRVGDRRRRPCADVIALDQTAIRSAAAIEVDERRRSPRPLGAGTPPP